MTDFQNIKIIEYLKEFPKSSSKEIYDNLNITVSYTSLKRILNKLLKEGLISQFGRGKATKYSISKCFFLVESIDIEEYYKKEIDERIINKNFNFEIITDVLVNCSIFSKEEIEKLERLQNEHEKKKFELTQNQYTNELERFAIDLSWKSSQIEGNTYSLLETEKLLKDKETASGKTKDEAVMLLNHKDALDFILEHQDYLNPISVSKIEDIHSILIKELEVDRNLRTRRVGISGTNYTPLDNGFQIKEALKNSCTLINIKKNVFEKALLALLLISYVQPFMDGNKRTARIVSNSILINYNFCPLSFRTVDSIDYKKAMLLFYEQNNLYHFKKIFIEQFEFAVKTYF